MVVHSPVTIAGIRFGNRLMNGAYIGSKSLEDIQKLARTPAGAIVVGSISIKPRTPNAGRGYWRHKENFYSLNSFGMPNGGVPYFQEKLPQMVKIAHAQSKPLVVNVIGFSKEEFPILIKLAEDAGADMVELNFGCPNVWKNGAQERIISYNAPLVRETLDIIKKYNPGIPICVKISPLPPDLLVDVSKAIVNAGFVQAVTATNSYPNASTSSGTKVLNEDALAGMTGRALKPISLGVVKQLRHILPSTIDIIGCGGISTMNDVNDYLTNGASSVQIATALVDTGLSVFKNILSKA